MIRTVALPLISGTLHMLLSVWWLIVILLAAKFGPRIVRGILLQRGGLR